MADTISTENTLAIGFEYTDSETNTTKTTYFKVPNPKDNITESQIRQAAQQLISSATPLLLDKNANPFDTSTAIATAYTETTTKRELDIGLT